MLGWCSLNTAEPEGTQRSMVNKTNTVIKMDSFFNMAHRLPVILLLCLKHKESCQKVKRRITVQIIEGGPQIPLSAAEPFISHSGTQ
ncbi:hypothetical protein B14911_27720 [Bacillus sp. NRRL B-14911]|nr:hypothetical protein B14911_27720 [Bacillus sp. NRRL B-14911]